MRPRTYWNTLINTLTNPKYYVDILNARLRFTARFVLISYVLLSLLAATLFWALELPMLRETFTNYLSKVTADFPVTQEVQWNGLQTSLTEPTEPVSLPFPQFPDGQGLPPKLVVIDPRIMSVNEIPSQGDAERSMFFVGKHQLYVAQPGGGWSEMSLTDVLSTTPFTISKYSLESSQPEYQEQIGRVLQLLPLAFGLFYFFIAFPLRIFNVIVDTVIIFILVKVLGLPFGFKKVLQISLHAAVAAELISVVTSHFAAGLPMFSLAFWGYIILIYWHLRNVKAFTLNEVGRRDK